MCTYNKHAKQFKYNYSSCHYALDNIIKIVYSNDHLYKIYLLRVNEVGTHRNNTYTIEAPMIDCSKSHNDRDHGFNYKREYTFR